MGPRTSILIGIAVAIPIALGIGSPVAADPAGPTDYRSEVTEITPPTETVDARIIGGDSFIELEVEPGVEVIVLGYRAEPYLRFRADGGIEHNRRSPAVSLNQTRYGGEVDAEADPDADPVWERIGSGHRWAWHDHRVHRMERFAPLGAARGDQILDDAVPILVDSEPVTIGVISTWMPAPSRAPMILGLIAGAAAVAAVWWRTRRWQAVATTTAIAATGALIVGAVQFTSLPASTDPALLWWLMPSLAAVAATTAVIIDARSESLRFWAPGIFGLGAVQLGIWALERRSGLWRAIVPTPLPFWADRTMTAIALTVSAGAIAVAIAHYARLLNGSTARPVTPHPRHR